jgi:hypothetical protein
MYSKPSAFLRSAVLRLRCLLGLYAIWVRIRLWYVTIPAQSYATVMDATHSPASDKFSLSISQAVPSRYIQQPLLDVPAAQPAYTPTFTELLRSGTIGVAWV